MKRRGELSPAFMLLLLRLSIDTYVNELEYAEWLRLHLGDLRLRFHRSDEPDSSRAEHTFFIWARREFLAEQMVESAETFWFEAQRSPS